jgi:DNA-directed RNA polymerase
LGLSSLQRTLAGISNDADSLDSDAAKQRRLQRQILLEKRAIETAQQRWYKEMDSLKAKGVGDASNNKTISLIMEKWHRDLVDSIKQELVLVEQEMKKNKSKANDKYSKERRDYGVFLRCMQPETLAAITVMHVIQIFTRSGIQKGVKVPIMVTGIGKEIQHELIAQKVLAQNPEDHKRRDAIKKIFENRHGRNGSMRFKKLMKENEMLMDADTFWPVNVSAKVGSVLMRLFFDTAKVAVPQVDPKTKEQFMFMEPAFQHSYEIDRGRKFGVLHTHPEISRKLVRDKPSVLQVRHMPMLSEPKAWTGYQDGGFLGHPSQIMRCSPGDGLQKAYIKKALEDDGLPEIRTSLDILGKTAWTINDAVFAVMKEAWNTGEEFPNIPPLDPNLPKPSPPKDDSPAEQAYYNKQLRDLENTVSALHSQRCFMNFQMEIAQAYLNETFFLPHNMDFRGRAYPVPAYLNQMGADNARGLLLFKKARPLGKSGLSWLKVHIANVFGFDKASFQEREGFTDKHLDDVLDSANNGLHGRRWFFQAEDPWQCLSACLELRNALRLEDPTQYMSRLPIHQDGSCNGLQHYAALGGDLQGAQHVNLEPGERPKDIYTGVCDLVIEQLAKDAANGNELAKSLEGKMKRKIVKQTVMTNVYGVTFIGAIRQVRRQLIAHYPDLPDMSASSIYITRAIFNALGSLFSGAHSIQYWLGDCASRICQSLSPFQLDELAKRTLSEAKDQNVRNEEEQDEEEMEEEEEQFEMNPVKMFRAPVIWTSPLGLPVVQPYRTVKCRRVYTSLQSLNLQQDDGGVGGVVSKRKQLQAFPPNFIHSLDATHMMLSALECDRRGLTFAAVHDSFWTHAGDVDTMNSALREAFIRMHSDNVTKRLAAEFKVRYDGYLFLAKIPAKSPIAVKIVQNRRKNKSTMLSEVVLEYQRQTLLRSDDPEMQAQGRAMTTGASIFEEMNGTNDDIAIPSTLGETATGAINEERKESGRVYSSVDEKDPAIASLFTDLDPQFLEFETTKTDDESEPKATEEGAAPKRNAPNKFTWTWLPLTFRDVPAKGEFDVNRLRDSKYFFS